MSLIWTIIIGLVVGMMGKELRPGQEPSGFWLTALLGIVGAVLISTAGSWLGLYRPGQPLSFVAAVIGASTFVLLFNTVRRMRMNRR